MEAKKMWRVVYEWELPPLRAIYRDEIEVLASSEGEVREQAPSWMSARARLRKVISIVELETTTITAKSWNDFTWPDWVPNDIRERIEDFWSESWGRSPAEWDRNRRDNGYPPLGSIVLAQELSGRKMLCGRYVHAWNNIGRLVREGKTEYISGMVTLISQTQ